MQLLLCFPFLIQNTITSYRVFSFLAWSYSLIAIVMWNNKLNLQTSVLDSSLHFYNFYFNSLIYKTNSWTKWFLKSSQLEHSTCLKLMENSVLPKHRKQFSGSNTYFKISSLTVTAIKFCPEFYISLLE